MSTVIPDLKGLRFDDEVFVKASDKVLQDCKITDDPKFRFAVQLVARDLIAMAEYSNISPPAISSTALHLVCRYAWDLF